MLGEGVNQRIGWIKDKRFKAEMDRYTNRDGGRDGRSCPIDSEFTQKTVQSSTTDLDYTSDTL